MQRPLINMCGRTVCVVDIIPKPFVLQAQPTIQLASIRGEHEPSQYIVKLKKVLLWLTVLSKLSRDFPDAQAVLTKSSYPKEGMSKVKVAEIMHEQCKPLIFVDQIIDE